MATPPKKKAAKKLPSMKTKPVRKPPKLKPLETDPSLEPLVYIASWGTLNQKDNKVTYTLASAKAPLDNWVEQLKRHANIFDRISVSRLDEISEAIKGINAVAKGERIAWRIVLTSPEMTCEAVLSCVQLTPDIRARLVD